MLIETLVAVEVVVVGRNLQRLAVARRVLKGWMRASVSAEGDGDARLHEEVRRRLPEIELLRAAVAKLDHAVLETYGGLNRAVRRCAALETEAAAIRLPKPAITAGRTWQSMRVPE